MIDPITTIGVVKGASEISKKLYELGKNVKDREHKQQIDEITDHVRALKRMAEELEDENRDLREKLRFKSDEFEFRNPYWYEKTHPDRPLCPTCFADNKAAPMSERGVGACGENSRLCLVCKNIINEVRFTSTVLSGGRLPSSWME
ncbi:MAG TPA: hypothetical protein VGG46_08910 [Terriglobales bacterium]|jgi:hypothetical protein